MTSQLNRFLTGIMLVLAFPAADASAQEFGRVGQITAQGVPYQVFVQAGEPSVQVTMIGSAGAGVYEIGIKTELTKLLALSGAGSVADPDKVEISLYRASGQQREIVYQASLERILTTPAEAPVLQDGDVLYIEVEEEKEGINWRDVLTVVSSLGSLVVVVTSLLR